MNGKNLNDSSEEHQDNLLDENANQSTPKRHGCVTAWLVFMLILNSLTALVYAFRSMSFTNISSTVLLSLIITGILNTVFAIMLLKWKKSAFYGFGITAVFIFILNINIGISVTKSLMGLLGFAILYCILQIKENGVSAWNYLK